MISLFCPSRGRPRQARELLASFLATKTTNEIELIFLVDDDDPTINDYPTGYVLSGQPTGDPTGPLNRAALGIASRAVGFVGDDSRCETPGWDFRVAEAIDESPSFVWGLDGHGPPWPSWCFVSKEIVMALGWLSLPTLHRVYFDEVWVELARATHSAKIFGDVMVRHDNSPGDPRSPNFDPVMQTPPEICVADEKAFRAWRDGPQFDLDVRNVAAVVNARFFQEPLNAKRRNQVNVRAASASGRGGPSGLPRLCPRRRSFHSEDQRLRPRSDLRQ